MGRLIQTLRRGRKDRPDAEPEPEEAPSTKSRRRKSSRKKRSSTPSTPTAPAPAPVSMTDAYVDEPEDRPMASVRSVTQLASLEADDLRAQVNELRQRLAATQSNLAASEQRARQVP